MPNKFEYLDLAVAMDADFVTHSLCCPKTPKAFTLALITDVTYGRAIRSVCSRIETVWDALELDFVTWLFMCLDGGFSNDSIFCH